MKILLCFCPECKRYRSTRAALVRSRRKGQRSRERYLLKRGIYDQIGSRLYVGYTDWPLYASVRK